MKKSLFNRDGFFEVVMLFNFDVSSRSHVSVNLNGTSGLCEVVVTHICDDRSFSANLSYLEYDKLVEFLKVREHDYAFDEAQARFGYPYSDNFTERIDVAWVNQKALSTL